VPFFTTKASGMGSIFEAHGGEISAENESEGGAIFRVILPIHRTVSLVSAGAAFFSLLWQCLLRSSTRRNRRGLRGTPPPIRAVLRPPRLRASFTFASRSDRDLRLHGRYPYKEQEHSLNWKSRWSTSRD
jgi:hypothetical protein